MADISKVTITNVGLTKLIDGQVERAQGYIKSGDRQKAVVALNLLETAVARVSQYQARTDSKLDKALVDSALNANQTVQNLREAFNLPTTGQKIKASAVAAKDAVFSAEFARDVVIMALFCDLIGVGIYAHALYVDPKVRAAVVAGEEAYGRVAQWYVQELPKLTLAGMVGASNLASSATDAVIAKADTLGQSIQRTLQGLSSWVKSFV
jgi:hypothetical protein